MSVTLENGRILLSGRCRVEDAEPLLCLLQDDAARPVDVSGVTSIHTAVVQVLLAAGAAVSGQPVDATLAAWLLPILQGRTAPIERGNDRL